jgi:hypothetical protein
MSGAAPIVYRKDMKPAAEDPATFGSIAIVGPR